jgi:hypothetical protein
MAYLSHQKVQGAIEVVKRLEIWVETIDATSCRGRSVSGIQKSAIAHEYSRTPSLPGSVPLLFSTSPDTPMRSVSIAMVKPATRKGEN